MLQIDAKTQILFYSIKTAIMSSQELKKYKPVITTYFEINPYNEVYDCISIKRSVKINPASKFNRHYMNKIIKLQNDETFAMVVRKIIAIKQYEWACAINGEVQ